MMFKPHFNIARSPSPCFFISTRNDTPDRFSVDCQRFGIDPSACKSTRYKHSVQPICTHSSVIVEISWIVTNLETVLRLFFDSFQLILRFPPLTGWSPTNWKPYAVVSTALPTSRRSTWFFSIQPGQNNVTPFITFKFFWIRRRRIADCWLRVSVGKTNQIIL